MTMPGVDEALLTRLRNALQRTRQFGVETLSGPMWYPTPGSEAAREIAEAVARWSDERHIRTTYAIANVAMTGVLDQLGALERLLRNPMPVIGPTVLTRSLIEIAANAWWLMEPGLGVDRRLSRDLVLSLVSVRQAAAVAPMLYPPGPDLQEVVDQEKRVQRRIAGVGLQVGGTHKKPQIGGEKLQDATQLTADMLHASLGASSSPRAVYKSYSAVSHGTIYGLLTFAPPRAEPDGTMRLHWGPNQEILDSTVQIAIVSFREAWTRVNAMMGWDTAKVEQAWDNDLASIFNP